MASWHLDTKMAQDIVARTMRIIDTNINVMDARGRIIGSGDRERIGELHEGALLEIRRTPRTIQMVQSDELLLAVGASTHALGAAQQDTHLTAPHFAEQVFLLRLALGVVDEGDLVFGNTQFQQFCVNIIINAEGAVILWGGEVAKNHLRGALVSGAPPDLKHIFRALGSFAVGVAGEHGVDQPLIQRQLSAIIGDEQHIVHAAVHLAVADFLSALRQRRHDLFLILRWL